jgi:hypothetical protein
VTNFAGALGVSSSPLGAERKFVNRVGRHFEENLILPPICYRLSATATVASYRKRRELSRGSAPRACREAQRRGCVGRLSAKAASAQRRRNSGAAGAAAHVPRDRASEAQRRGCVGRRSAEGVSRAAAPRNRREPSPSNRREPSRAPCLLPNTFSPRHLMEQSLRGDGAPVVGGNTAAAKIRVTSYIALPKCRRAPPDRRWCAYPGGGTDNTAADKIAAIPRRRSVP